MRSAGSHASLLTWRHSLLASLGVVAACGGSVENSSTGDGTTNTGGTATGGGAGGAGGSGGAVNGGMTATGGFTATGGAMVGGMTATGGVTATGGSVATGGAVATGGVGGDVVHRPVATTCTPFQPRPESQIPPDTSFDGGVGTLECEFDADCTERAHGYCVFQSPADYYDPYSLPSTRCAYGCATDADCDPGRVCSCTGMANQCITASCGVDANCGPGYLCLYTSYDDGCGTRSQYACQTPLDTCASDADCIAGEQCGYADYESRHLCIGMNCAIGRPFLVAGTERLASSARRNDWCRDALLDAPRSAEQARELAARWTTIGLMEHASIAAFARFAMQLLALGAPPDLVTQATAAMHDELGHAEIAFGFATTYAGRPVGPGPLAMDRALERMDVESILVDVVLEGCVGESVAAHEARVASEAARDATVRAALTRVAAEERRHAELAWRFVAWVLETRPELGALVDRTVRRALDEARASAMPSGDDAWLAPYGIVPEAERRALRIDVMEALVVPCAQGLLGARSAA